jgi:PAS domain S-box-containing protein
MEELAKITQHLLRSSPDALVVIDDRGQIRFANDTVTELFGYTPEQLLGQPLDMLVPERLRSRHGHHIAGFFREPRNREMGASIAELYARRADGTEFAAGIRLAPFKIGDRALVAAAIRDTTERHRINEALIAAREEAVRANRAKSRFLATASHDLRQPLQTIKLLNAAMIRLAGPSEIAELLKHQGEALEGATRLLNALLDISRLESGAIEPQCSNVVVAELLKELRAEFETIARARGLDLNLQSAPVTVVTDRALFYQLLQNLVANALKYTDRGSVSVICVEHAESLRIHIRDTGIGIPPDKLARIFDEYYQVDTHGTKRMGVGLGLAIVKEVARLLSFKLSITSTLGRCTEVTLDIPASHWVASAPAAAPVNLATPVAAAAPAARVVLIEDNDGVRMATELFLRLEGYEVRSAASYAEAEALLTSLRSGDLIIADYHLDSSHTGLEVLERARHMAGSEIPAIIMSGDLPTLVRSLQAPVAATRFLSKPVDTNALLEALRELSAV